MHLNAIDDDVCRLNVNLTKKRLSTPCDNLIDIFGKRSMERIVVVIRTMHKIFVDHDVAIKFPP